MSIVSKLFDLSGRTIVVAGGAGQIGFAFCTALADAGATVVIADIDTEMAQTKLQGLNNDAIRKRIQCIGTDVSNAQSIDEFYKKFETDFGKLSGLINSFHFKGNTRKLDTASNFFADFENYPEVAWDSVHDINLKGTFLMSQRSVRLFRTNGRGVIVNVSSTYGNVSPNKSIYGASGINSPVSYASSKAAIINLTRYMATHLADEGIRVNVLSPGGVYNNQSEEFVKNYKALTPLHRMATPEDYQGAIIFLMSDASNYMTGANLIVDGGWTSW